MRSGLYALRWGWIAAVSAGCTTLAGIDQDYVAVGASGTAGEPANGGAAGTFGGAGGVDGAGGSNAGGSGGASGSNGSSGAGNTRGSGGSGAGGSGGSVVCGQGQKSCNNECVTPSVANGCALDVCEACPAPNVEHVEVWCNSQQNCDVRCVEGYVPSAGRCVPEGTVGTGGSGGGGGTGGTSGGTGGTSGGAGGGGNGGSGGSGASSGTSGSGGSGGSGGRCSPNSCPPCPAPDGKIPCCTLSGRCGCGYPVVGAFYCI